MLDFRGQDLNGHHFENETLVGADFRGADLQYANFQQAIVTGADFRDADLLKADFTGAVGLSVEKLGGAVLLDAALPPHVDLFKGLEGVAESSKYIQSIFKILLAVCAFALLTVLSIRDENIVLHNASPTTIIPLIQASVSITQFGWIVPLIIFVLFAYQLCHLRELWVQMSLLPAVFPDGGEVDRRAYPLLMNCLTRKYFSRLLKDPPTLLQISISYLLIFGITAFTFMVFWLEFLKKHDYAVTAFQLTLLSLCLSLWFNFARLGRLLLGGDASDPKHHGATTSLGVLRNSLLLGAAVFVVLLGASHLAFEGHFDEVDPLTNGFFSFNVDIEDRAISTFPPTPPAAGDELDDLDRTIEHVKGADLDGLDLRRAAALRANMAKSSLMHTDLRGADLTAAVLRDTRMDHARMEGAILRETNLRGALLKFARLKGAIFAGDDTPENPRPLFGRANIQYAHLEGAEFDPKEIVKCNNYKLAYYSQSMVGPLGLNPEGESPDSWNHNDHMRQRRLDRYDFSGQSFTGGDLRSYGLEGANFTRANLREVRLQGANLQRATLIGADLQEAKLSRADLRGAKLDRANLPRGEARRRRPPGHGPLRRPEPGLRPARFLPPGPRAEAPERLRRSEGPQGAARGHRSAPRRRALRAPAVRVAGALRPPTVPPENRDAVRSPDRAPSPPRPTPCTPSRATIAPAPGSPPRWGSCSGCWRRPRPRPLRANTRGPPAGRIGTAASAGWIAGPPAAAPPSRRRGRPRARSGAPASPPCPAGPRGCRAPRPRPSASRRPCSVRPTRPRPPWPANAAGPHLPPSARPASPPPRPTSPRNGSPSGPDRSARPPADNLPASTPPVTDGMAVARNSAPRTALMGATPRCVTRASP